MGSSGQGTCPEFPKIAIWDLFFDLFFPQIVIAIGVLTSNRGEGDELLWRIGRGTRVPLQGAVDVPS